MYLFHTFYRSNLQDEATGFLSEMIAHPKHDCIICENEERKLAPSRNQPKMKRSQILDKIILSTKYRISATKPLIFFRKSKRIPIKGKKSSTSEKKTLVLKFTQEDNLADNTLTEEVSDESLEEYFDKSLEEFQIDKTPAKKPKLNDNDQEVESFVCKYGHCEVSENDDI